MNKNMNELCTHYNLDECTNKKLVISKLKFFSDEGKILYNITSEILKIDDIDLEDKDIDYLIKLFNDNDCYQENDYDDSDDEWDDDSYGDDSYDDEY